jgi:hypothetical protein
MSADNCPRCNQNLASPAECGACGWQSAAPGARKSPGNLPADQAGKPVQRHGEVPSPSRHLSPPPRNPPLDAPPAGGNTDDNQPPAPAAESSPEEKGVPAEQNQAKNSHPTPQAGNRPSFPKDMKADHFIRYQGDRAVIGQNVIQNIYHQAQQTPKAAREVSYQGDHGVAGETVNVNHNYYGPTDPAPFRATKKSEVSLADLTTTLPRRDPDIPARNAYQFSDHLQTLEREHLLILTSLDDRVAIGAAYALLDELRIDDSDRRLLSFDGNVQNKVEVGMQFFTQNPTEQQSLTGIVVGAFNTEARTFLDWLLNGERLFAMKLRDQLRTKRMVLICLAHEGYVSQACEGNRNRVNFSKRKIPFLTPLLTHYFPESHAELEEKITEQRARGKWPSADADFCNELRPYLEPNELRNAIESREATDVRADEPALQLPRISSEEPLQSTLLYVATYFPNLAPHEFDLVVSSLLKGKTTTIKVKSQVKTSTGEIETIETEAQKPLIDFWNEDSDRYLRRCQLEAMPGPNSTTIIDFTDGAVRHALRSQFEKRHSLYVMRQFQAVHQHQLLFNSTPAITKNVITLTVDMSMAHPDSYGEHWLFGLLQFTHAEDLAAAAARARASVPAYSIQRRVTELLRQMLVKPQLSEMVNSLLKNLMSIGDRHSVLYIVRGLQFAPRFDEFPWIKRLLDEGDDIERLLTYYHLYSYIRKIGIYPLLAKLDLWIPSQDQTDHYSLSTMYALRLLVEYCSETIIVDPSRDVTPRLNPLLSFPDESSARENLARLIKWMFHPAMEAVFDEMETSFSSAEFDTAAIPFVCEIVANWMFFLKERKTRTTTTGAQALPPTQDSGVPAAAVAAILFQEIARITVPAQRDEMLGYWEDLRDVTAFLLTAMPAELLDQRKQQAHIRWQLGLVKELLKEFRSAIRALRVAGVAAPLGAAQPILV